MLAMINPINHEKSEITVKPGKKPSSEIATPTIVAIYAEILKRFIFMFIIQVKIQRIDIDLATFDDKEMDNHHTSNWS